MGRELTDLPFETWVTFVFDHPAPDSDTPTGMRKSEVIISPRGILNVTATGGIHLVNQK